MATAEQTVSAVLDATNKRYVVEMYKTDDGSGGYTLYSDGYCEQWGTYVLDVGIAHKSVTQSLYRSYKDTNYYSSASILTISDLNNGYSWATYTTIVDSGTIQFHVGGRVGDGATWETRGYVA